MVFLHAHDLNATANTEQLTNNFSHMHNGQAIRLLTHSHHSNMVQIFESTVTFNHTFGLVSYAYLNRYPNPYAKHVLSQDTLESFVDEHGSLHTTKFIIKRGRLPKFITPFVGGSVDSWIIEKTVINPKTQVMLSYTSNIDHRKFIRVEEVLKYTGNNDRETTTVVGKVKFSSNFIGFKQRIEEWSRNRFSKNITNSREGLKFVMNSFLQNKNKIDI